METKSFDKTMVCFANSRKLGGRCVAGKELIDGKPGKWIRPISERQDQELSLTEYSYKNKSVPGLLDIIKIKFQSHKPSENQIENYLIDSHIKWVKQGQISMENVLEWLDNPETLWNNGESSMRGFNNRISVNKTVESSLRLIAVDSIQLIVKSKRKYSEYSDISNEVQCQFFYNDVKYRLDVTDPHIENTYCEIGNYDISDVVLCISLGENYKGYYYKLVAGILYKDRF